MLGLSLVVCAACDAAADNDNVVAGSTSVSTAAPADLQDLILSDGVVTTEEIQQAHRVAVQCIRAAGFDADFERNLVGQYQIGIDTPRGVDGAAFESAMDDVVNACSDKYLDRVSPTYHAQSR